MKKTFLNSIIAFTLLLVLVFPTIAYGATCGKDDEGKDIQTSFDFHCSDSDAAGNTVISLLLTVINFMAVGVGIAVVGGIVFGALRYTSANGNAAQAQQGITYIVNSVIGLALFISMYAIINFLVPGGLFT